MAFFRKVWAIVAKDVSAELRNREMLSAMFVFTLLVLLIFNFAFDLRGGDLTLLAPGVLWVAIFFAGMLGLSRSFIVERDRGGLDGLLLAPMDRSAIFLGKMLGNVLFMLVVEVFVLPLFMVLFNLRPGSLVPLAGVMVLGTIGFAGVGTLFSAMVIQTRAREVLLPVLLFPVILPVVLASVRLTATILDRVSLGEANHWLSMLVAFDVIFVALSLILFDYVIEE